MLGAAGHAATSLRSGLHTFGSSCWRWSKEEEERRNNEEEQGQRARDREQGHDYQPASDAERPSDGASPSSDAGEVHACPDDETDAHDTPYQRALLMRAEQENADDRDVERDHERSRPREQDCGGLRALGPPPHIRVSHPYDDGEEEREVRGEEHDA